MGRRLPEHAKRMPVPLASQPPADAHEVNQIGSATGGSSRTHWVERTLPSVRVGRPFVYDGLVAVPRPSAVPPPPHEERAGPPIEVLIVDDEPLVLKALERSLRPEGFAVRPAAGASAALAALDPAISVVVSDYRMPGMDGVAFLAEVARRQPETRRVLLTGQADLHALADAINQGAVHRLFFKPWEPRDLVTALREEGRQAALAGDAAELRRVADRRTHELELARRLLRVQRLAAVGQLAAGLAHELNNPLSAILAFSQLLLRDGKLSADDLDAVQVIERAAQRCKRVVAAVAKFGVPVNAAPGEVVLDEMAGETLDLLGPELRAAAAEVVTTFEAPPLRVWGSFPDLQQITGAFLRNALEAASPGDPPRISVSTFGRGETACLSVADAGPGIAAEVRDRVFDPFFTTRSEAGAAGLGLTIAERIAETHGGQIEIVSEPGSGTTATLVLPRWTGP